MKIPTPKIEDVCVTQTVKKWQNVCDYADDDRSVSHDDGCPSLQPALCRFWIRREWRRYKMSFFFFSSSSSRLFKEQNNKIERRILRVLVPLLPSCSRSFVFFLGAHSFRNKCQQVCALLSPPLVLPHKLSSPSSFPLPPISYSSFPSSWRSFCLLFFLVVIVSASLCPSPLLPPLSH